jgi:hypothetical protein
MGAVAVFGAIQPCWIARSAYGSYVVCRWAGCPAGDDEHMQAVAQDPDLAKGLSTSRVGVRRHLRVGAMGWDAGGTMIAPTDSEMIIAAPPRVACDHGFVGPRGQASPRGRQR